RFDFHFFHALHFKTSRSDLFEFAGVLRRGRCCDLGFLRDDFSLGNLRLRRDRFLHGLLGFPRLGDGFDWRGFDWSGLDWRGFDWSDLDRSGFDRSDFDRSHLDLWGHRFWSND
ncbi:MAG: hypothetical protein GTN93_34945, partial [Anaerolineae bacterium]|nr:hypothetical protein [Anaerolineae bacterium]